jgi:dolichol-phosphate mannosyltransferase
MQSEDISTLSALLRMGQTTLKKLLRQRVFRFLVGGGIAAAFNLLLIFVLVDIYKFDTPFLRNVANAVSIELSLLLSFFIYRIWVWPGGSWNIGQVLWAQLPLYHISAGSAIATRIFLVFPILDWLGVNYAINTIIGISAGASLNYILNDSLVFKTKGESPGSQKEAEPSSELYHPEGLETALLRKPNLESSLLYKEYIAQESNILRSLTLSIVIPACNEEGCIEQTIQGISQVLEEQAIDYEILVVNDHSQDYTETLLRQINAQDQKVRYVNNYYPNGFGFAVRCALENYKGDAVAVVMADGSDAPEDIVNYYHKLLEGYDCVFGSRFIEGGKAFGYPFHKLVLNRLANLFIQILFGLKFNDTTNSFKIYRREVINGVCPLISHHFNLTVEMPLKAIARGYSYAVIPITWRNRTTGISKLRIKEMGSRYLFIVLYVFLEKRLSRGDYVHKHPQQQAVRTRTP